MEIPLDDPRETRKAFAALLALPDDAIDLGHASLLIAREEYPHLDVQRYLARLDEMADEIRRRMTGREGDASQIAHLNRLLNEVLDRRMGIPITLSMVYLEVGRRIGCRLEGVAFPGHFLVRLCGRPSTPGVLIDPFNRGQILTEQECARLLQETYGGKMAFRPELLKRARNREILQRMLHNLKWIYHRQRDFHMALRIQQLLLCIAPDRPEDALGARFPRSRLGAQRPRIPPTTPDRLDRYPQVITTAQRDPLRPQAPGR